LKFYDRFKNLIFNDKGNAFGAQEGSFIKRWSCENAFGARKSNTINSKSEIYDVSELSQFTQVQGADAVSPETLGKQVLLHDEENFDHEESPMILRFNNENFPLQIKQSSDEQ
jgi:hypothetical protein